MTNEICYMEDFFEKAGDLDNQFYTALDLQSSGEQQEAGEESESEENPRKYQSYNDTMDDIERRIKLYGQLDQTSKISKKIGVSKKQVEGKEININFYDQGDEFIDDDEEGNLKGKEMTLVYAEYDDFQFFEGPPEEFIKSELYQNRVKMITNLGKQNTEEVKKKGQGTSSPKKSLLDQKDKYKDKIKEKEKEKQKQKDKVKEKEKEKVKNKQKDKQIVKNKEKVTTKEADKSKDVVKDKNAEAGKILEKIRKPDNQNLLVKNIVNNYQLAKRLPTKDPNEKQDQHKKPKKKLKKQVDNLSKDMKKQSQPINNEKNTTIQSQGRVIQLPQLDKQKPMSLSDLCTMMQMYSYNPYLRPQYPNMSLPNFTPNMSPDKKPMMMMSPQNMPSYIPLPTGNMNPHYPSLPIMRSNSKEAKEIIEINEEDS